MRISHCNNVLVGVVIIGCCVLDAYCKDFNNTYKNCVKNSDSQQSPAVQQYTKCFTSTSNFKSDPQCDSIDVSKCITQLADDVVFQKCIGSTNLETLEVVAKIFHAQFEYVCSDAGRNATQKFVANDGPACNMKHQTEVLQCYSDAKYPIAARSIDVGMLSGFAFDEEYCRTLAQFDECEMTALADCHSDVKHLTRRNHESRWNASPCAGFSNSGQEALVSSVLTSAIAVWYTGTKLFGVLSS